MKNSPFPALLVIFAALAATPAAAQQRGSVQQAPHSMNPSTSSSASSTSRLQQQLMLDYDAILIRKQREREQQNQSGTKQRDAN
jgi:hypothetical protein